MANLYDRVQESTTTTGTGTYALGGAVTGFRTFNSQAANGTVIRCVIEDGVGGYEVGDYTLGTNTLARTTIIESSNSNNAVNWGSGTKYIYSDATVRDVLPDQTSNSGKLLITDGISPSWSNTVSSLTLSGGTANGVLYLNGSKQATSGSALTFDGTTLTTAGGVGTAQIALRIKSVSANSQGFNVITNSSTDDVSLVNHYNAGLIFGTNNAERGRFSSDGTFRVKGAGTAGSTDAFQVSGSAPASAVSVGSNGDMTINGLTVGRGAGSVSTNTAVGATALANNSSGYGNFAGGTSALYANTTGYSNVAIGSFDGTLHPAMRFNTTGYYNVAIGTGSLAYNTTGSYNTASGVQALYNNTTGSSNEASGQAALFSNTTGNYNTASGKGALYYNTTGSGNTAINPLNSAGTYAPVFDPTTENNRFCMGSTGVTNAYIQVAWTVVSDARDKTEFAPVPHGLAFVNQLKPTAYRYKLDRESTEAHGPVRYGFKAQDVLALEGDNPVIVDAEDADKLRFNDQSLLAVLVNAIQELKAELDELKSQLGK